MKIGGGKNLLTNNSIFFDIRCHLHTLCNLRCKFCSETKEKGIRENNNINIDYIKQLPDEIINAISPMLKRDGRNIISVGLQGGELFSDDLPDSMLDEYGEFCFNLQSKLKEKNLDIEFKLIAISNGVFKNYNRVEKFLRKFNIRLTLSYDPVDRFSCNSQKEVWYETFKYFKDKKEFNVHISTVFTKKNIDVYLAGDEMFERIGNDICVVNHEYFPRLDYHDYLASDEDLFRFYKWALDNNKFNIAHIYNIIISYKTGKPSTTCNETMDYLFDENYKLKYNKGYINQCADNPIDKQEYYGEYASQITDDTDCSRCKESSGIQKRCCLLCEYYSQCPKMCWTQILFDKYEMATCPIHQVYQYLENNPNIIDNYDNWRKENEDVW
jgi:hypothetical protein